MFMLFDLFIFWNNLRSWFWNLKKHLTSSRVYMLNPIFQIFNLGAFTIQIPPKNQILKYHNRTNICYIIMIVVDCCMPIQKKTSCDINKNVHFTLPYCNLCHALLETNASRNRLHVGFPKKFMIHAKYYWIFSKTQKINFYR
jgi:hypothetical protein